MKKLQEEWARRLNGIQWKLLVKYWFGILPGRRRVELWYCFWETMDQQMMIQEPPHFLLKKSWPREKWIEIQSSNLSSGETHTHTREFTRIFGSVPRHCPTEKNSSFFHYSEHFPKPHNLRDKLTLELLTSLTLPAWENSLSEFSKRDHIPQAVDQMLLGNTENKASLSFPFILGNHQWSREVADRSVTCWMKEKRERQQFLLFPEDDLYLLHVRGI